MNTNQDLLEKIEYIIQSVYRDRAVNPWESGRKRSAHFETLFRNRLQKWPLLNQSDHVHGSSTALAFLLHPGHYIGIPTRDGIEVRMRRLGGVCFQSLLEISHLGPFARVRFTRETLETESGVIVYEERETPFRREDREFLVELKEVLEEQEIEIVPVEILDLPVPDIRLDVTEPGDVTVYHCLFDEE